jgi:DNA-binding MarR family transcriptional regulator
MDKKELIENCASLLLDVVPMVRGNIVAHIHKEVTDKQWVSPGQMRIMYLIDDGERTTSDLAARQRVSVPTVSRQVDCLVSKGLLLRNRDGNDRRILLLQLTPDGKQLLDTLTENTRQWLGQRIESLDEGEIQDISSALELLRAIFRPPQTT